jgi:hypothetical protein
MSLESRFVPSAITRGLFLFVALQFGTVTSHAFTMDIVSQEVGDFGQGPSSIFVPGYGQVVFESVLDGTLVLDSAYASTERIDVPPPASRESGIHDFTGHTQTVADPVFVEIYSRTGKMTTSLSATLHPADDPLENPPGGWNAVPEAASATLGLIGTLLLFLRRRERCVARRGAPRGKSRLDAGMPLPNGGPKHAN